MTVIVKIEIYMAWLPIPSEALAHRLILTHRLPLARSHLVPRRGARILQSIEVGLSVTILFYVILLIACVLQWGIRIFVWSAHQPLPNPLDLTPFPPLFDLPITTLSQPSCRPNHHIWTLKSSEIPLALLSELMRPMWSCNIWVSSWLISLGIGEGLKLPISVPSLTDLRTLLEIAVAAPHRLRISHSQRQSHFLGRIVVIWIHFWI